METLTMYLLKMLICSGVLFGYYRLALYNERFHQWNRFYLLAAMCLSVIVPFISIPVFAEEEPNNMVVVIASMPWNSSVVSAPLETGLSWQEALVSALCIISITMFFRITANIGKLFIAYKTNPVNSLDNKVQLVLTQLKHAPFSFFNWLFWRQDIDPASDNGQRMLTHELTHIREHHSIDKIFTEVLLCMFWMNPFFWLMRRELGTVHEFLADRRAIEQQDGAAFAAMILHALQLQPAATSGLVNPFFSSTIKRRLQMITTSKEPKYSYLRRLSGLVLMICSAVALTLSIQQVNAQEKEKLAEKKASGNQVKQDTTVKVTDELIRRLPVDDSKSLVTKPGEIITLKTDSITWKGAKGEATGVTSSGEKVKIQIFKQEPTLGEILLRSATVDTVTSSNLRVRGFKINPLFILDGKEINSEEMIAINPNIIESVSVLKDGSAVANYGDKGKNGVIIITSKKLQEVEVVGFARPKDATQKLQEVEVVGFARPKDATQKLQEVEVVGFARPKDALQKLQEVEVVGFARPNDTIHKLTEIAIQVEARPSHGKAVGYDKVFTKVEQPAQFPGGEAAWMRYLGRNLLYPEAAIKAGTEGTARLRFIIDVKGNISNITILNNPGNGIGEEAAKLLSKCPKWQPAMQNGREVNYQVELSIDFQLSKHSRSGVNTAL